MVFCGLISLAFCLAFKALKSKLLTKAIPKKKALTRKKSKKFQPLTPTVYRYADVFRKLGFPISFEKHQFPEKKELPNRLLTLYQSSEKKWIGIAPFSAHQGKMYPLDLMQQIINFLQKDHQVFLFGAGQKEKERLEVWEKAYDNVF